MNKLAALLIGAGVLISGCADFGTAYRAADSEQKKKQQEPVDRNRNSVPDSLERQAVPMEPVIDRPKNSPD